MAPLREQLAPVLDALAASYDVELLFVDDGSRDRTVARIRELWPSRAAKVVSHPRNLGLGAALRTGAASARGQLILNIDSDCTFRPSEIPALLARLDDDTDIVTASPYHPQGGVVGVPAHRLVLSRTLSALYRLVTGSEISTYTSMFRVYRRAVLEDLPRWSDGFVAIAEILILPLLSGRRVREYPTVLHARRYGASKIRIVRTILGHLGFVPFALWWRVADGRRRDLVGRA